ncbi:AAA family ATPase [Actinocorallia sp. B10E7]|uniref:ATP-binding protein n=1 Tax=Actinocorallia sp. B10E7 TaxID=3153558 RepID=UPI00325D4197
MSHPPAAPRLVGRDRELSRLLDELGRSITQGASGVVVVRGEAGVGKSSLLTSLADHAVSRYSETGLLVGYGQAMLNSLASDSFQAVRECLRSLTLSAERSGSRDLLNRVADSFRLHAPDWVESVPVVGHLLAAGIRTGRSIADNGNPAPEMDSRLDQLIRLVEDLLSRGPLLLVLDDLHWADTATIDLLITMTLKVEGPLLLVLAYRPDNLQTGDGAETHPLRRAVFRLRRYRADCLEVDLEPLSARETEQLIRQVGGSRLPAQSVSQIIRLSAGNPLFAESLVRLGEQAVAAHAGTPSQITAILDERLSFLRPSDQRLLEAAALIGYNFEVEYLAQLARADIDDVYERLDVLFTEHSLVRPAEPRGSFDRYTLHHPLLAEVLRQRASQNGPRWRRQHQKLLEALEAEHPWDDELQVRAVAIAVAAGNRAKAAAFAAAACRRQFTLGAVSKAKELAEVAVEQARGTARTLDTLELLAECLAAGGNHFDAAITCATAAEQLRSHSPDTEREAKLQLLWARNLRMTNSWAECRALIDQLAASSSGPSETLAQALMLHAEIALCGPVQDVERCIQLCDVVAEMSMDPELQSRAYGHRGLAHLAGYDPVAAEQWLNKAIEVAREKEHPYAEYEAVHWLSKKAMACLELDRAWRLLEELARNSKASGVASESPWHLRDSSRVLGLQGRVPEAAQTFSHYYDSGYTHAGGRATTTLACQLHELEQLYGRRAGDAMLNGLTTACDREMVDPERRERLTQHLRALASRPPTWQPVPFAVRWLEAPQAEAEAADAIFRFDVADLPRLRSRLRAEG